MGRLGLIDGETNFIVMVVSQLNVDVTVGFVVVVDVGFVGVVVVDVFVFVVPREGGKPILRISWEF